MDHRSRRVGIDMPTIEVRFEHLDVEAEVRVGSSGLPTVPNSITNTLEEAATALHLLRSRKRKMPVLHDVSGVIKPRRYHACLVLSYMVLRLILVQGIIISLGSL
jgi:hypothetical protein